MKSFGLRLVEALECFNPENGLPKVVAKALWDDYKHNRPLNWGLTAGPYKQYLIFRETKDDLGLHIVVREATGQMYHYTIQPTETKDLYTTSQ